MPATTHEDAPQLLAPSRVPDTDYAEGLAPLHQAYAAAIERAHGHAIDPDAPLYAPNAIAYHGNSYRIDRVSLILLGESAVLYEGGFDPHAQGIRTPQTLAADESRCAKAAMGTGVVSARARNGGIEAYAELTYVDRACQQCHKEDERVPACLQYWLPELADD